MLIYTPGPLDGGFPCTGFGVTRDASAGELGDSTLICHIAPHLLNMNSRRFDSVLRGFGVLAKSTAASTTRTFAVLCVDDDFGLSSRFEWKCIRDQEVIN